MPIDTRHRLTFTITGDSLITRPLRIYNDEPFLSLRSLILNSDVALRTLRRFSTHTLKDTQQQRVEVSTSQLISRWLKTFSGSVFISLAINLSLANPSGSEQSPMKWI